MKAHWYVDIIKYLPDGFVSVISKKLVAHFVNKYAKINVVGKENLNGVNKPILYICNHLSNSDALVLNKVLNQDATFVAGIKLSQDSFTNLGRYFAKTITIKPGSADKDAISKVVKTLKSGQNVVIFPEGTRSRTGCMIEAKKGITLIEKLSKATIIPIGIYGSENLLPINKEGDMRSEKFYHAEVNVSFGTPVVFPEKLPEEGKHEYEDRCLTYAMKNISKLLPENYRGFYK